MKIKKLLSELKHNSKLHPSVKICKECVIVKLYEEPLDGREPKQIYHINAVEMKDAIEEFIILTRKKNNDNSNICI